MLTFVLMAINKKIILSVSNDLHTDQRLQKVCDSLQKAGYEVELLGRFLKGKSETLNRSYPCKRFRLWFNQGPLFYFNLNLRLFFYLLFHSFDLLIANDLDTLPANFLVARFRKKSLVYDSHEYFTEVPELIHRPKVQKFWERIEALILPKLKYAYTVSPSIAQAYEQNYGLSMRVVRNFPRLKEAEKLPSTPKEKVVIYQGALNVSRGLEELIRAFNFSILKDIKLWLFGSGDIEAELKALSRELELTDQVVFFGRKAARELKEYTQRASIGVSLEHPEGLSYQYAIPNKIFDYIHAGTAVLYSPLKEVEYLLDGRGVGQKLRSHEPKLISEQIREMMDSDELSQWQLNAKANAKNFSWQNEEVELIKIVKDALSN